MLLLTGPPGSGKTRHILDQVRGRLRSGRHGFRLLVPTATMAEHLRNQLAREGFVFRARLVSTLAGFIEPWTEGAGLISDALLDWMLQQALARVDRPEYRAVAGMAGFRAALARSIRELSAAGCRARALVPFRSAAALQPVYAEVENRAAERGVALDGQRLSKAADRIRSQGVAGIEEFFLDGFFGFTDPELDLIDAVHGHCEVTATLPSWQGAQASRARLIETGFQDQSLQPVRPQPRVTLLKAATQDREMEEIAARILEAGRHFREIGVVMRSPDPCLAALRAALERFGIPARFYFQPRLADHSLARQLLSTVENRGGPPATASEWGEQFLSLSASWRPPSAVEPEAREMAALWRAAATAQHDFADAVRETVAFFPEDARITNREFCQQLRTSLRLTTLRVPDHRRDVVHVMDAYEARQWELPMVFVCGILEKQFPLYHSPDPLLPDELRRQLRQQGVRLPAAAERDETERFLFDLTTTRATDTLVLSYPQFNSKGDENLRSFYLDRFLETAEGVREEIARAVRPVPRHLRPSPKRPVLQTASRTPTSPTEIEDFLQCPFLFFARRTLELKGPEIAPEKRLDANVQGEIVHEVLARWVRTREEIGPVLEEVFRRTCAREGIPGGYRTEAIRLELLRNLRRFVARAGAAAAGEVETEQDLALTLDGGVSLRCRIDRIDAMPDGRALIIDYKYSSPERTRKLVKQHAEGTRIQGGIYMLAVRDSGRQIAGMLFAGLRKASAWEGWDTRKEGVTQGELHQVMEQSRHTALQAIQRIQEGRIAPKPADTEICQYCAYRDVCRVEAVAGVVAAGEAEE